MNQLIVLAGPTAVGKTKLSLELAKAVNGEIISADSMQIYKYMDIGTAKITQEEMSGIQHHLIDLIDPREEWNVMLFQKHAKQCVQEIYSRGKVPLLVGGTGFYIQALLYDIQFAEYEDHGKESSIRKSLEQLVKEKGSEHLHRCLQEVDESSARSIHHNNVKRVIRALEYFQQTGEKFSLHNEAQRIRTSSFQSLYFVLNDDRSKIYQNIDQRVDQMILNGLLDEVEQLCKMGYTKDLVSMQGLGYKEVIRYFNGELSLEEAVNLIKRDTRHFAKRQLTWFKREQEVHWINRNELGSDAFILEEMIKQLSQIER